MLQKGKKAPDFLLSDQDGTHHSLKAFKGKVVLLYFYPKDMTPGCTVEAQVFRDMYGELTLMGVDIVGVSADSIASHKKFCDKHDLPFPLLSDEKKDMLKAYGVWKEKSMFGKKYMGISRESFLIDEKGIILKHYENVNPLKHGKEVLEDLKTLHTVG